MLLTIKTLKKMKKITYIIECINILVYIFKKIK